jgi:hypothetical protein
VKSKPIVVASWFVLALILAGLLLLAGGGQATGPAVAAEPHGKVPAGGASITATGWSSGWTDIKPRETLTFHHGLGGDPSDYAVQLWFLDTKAGGFGIHSRGYGGVEAGGKFGGAYWQNLDNSDIQVRRLSDDGVVGRVRVWVWVPQEMEQWCTEGWQPVIKGSSKRFDHNLGGDVDDYSVGLWFMETGNNGVAGVNQRAYGGMEDGGAKYGAWWYDLTKNSIWVRRAEDDLYAAKVRVCVSVPEPPDWDSKWQKIAPGQTLTLDHDLLADPNRYIVRMEFKHTAAGGIGIHHENAGGNAIGTTFVGANWQNLTDHQISAFRWSQDEHADEVRIRIWVRRIFNYLPVILIDG